MKDFSQLWQNARAVVDATARRADARLYGTPRARSVYQTLGQAERDAMRETVVTQFGQTAWDDFTKMVGG